MYWYIFYMCVSIVRNFNVYTSLECHIVCEETKTALELCVSAQRMWRRGVCLFRFAILYVYTSHTPLYIFYVQWQVDRKCLMYFDIEQFNTIRTMKIYNIYNMYTEMWKNGREQRDKVETRLNMPNATMRWSDGKTNKHIGLL